MSMTTAQFADLLATADERIQPELALALSEVSEEMRAYIQTIAHRRTGNMADSMHVLGPFPIGNGGLETTIQSGAFYAATEVQRGGAHDWATRAIAERPDLLDRLAQLGGEALVKVLTGGAP